MQLLRLAWMIGAYMLVSWALDGIFGSKPAPPPPPPAHVQAQEQQPSQYEHTTPFLDALHQQQR